MAVSKDQPSIVSVDNEEQFRNMLARYMAEILKTQKALPSRFSASIYLGGIYLMCTRSNIEPNASIPQIFTALELGLYFGKELGIPVYVISSTTQCYEFYDDPRRVPRVVVEGHSVGLLDNGTIIWLVVIYAGKGNKFAVLPGEVSLDNIKVFTDLNEIHPDLRPVDHILEKEQGTRISAAYPSNTRDFQLVTS